MSILNIFLHPHIRRLNCNTCLQEIEKISGFQVQLHQLDNHFWSCYRSEREQFDASCILENFHEQTMTEKNMIVTDVDLFLPIFTFVFGLAQLGGSTGIISIHRLRNEHYGLKTDDELLKLRMKKEIIHELGHLLGMRHCHNRNCIMASANNIDDLDVKSENFCDQCREIIDI